MTQLGTGLVGASPAESYPGMIDTYQTFRNGTPLAPDSDTRIDSEVLMDILRTLIAIETTLGTNPQGLYGSVALRLNALDSGIAAPASNVLPFTNQTSLTLPGTAHQQGQQALHYQVYDAASPRSALTPASVSVFPGTFDVLVTFAEAQSGMFMVAALSPQYVTNFTTTGTPPTAVILGSTHGLAETYLFFQAYSLDAPADALEVGSFQVHPATKNVTLTTAVPQSGTLVLGVGSPRYFQTFTNQTTITVLGTVHGLASADLLWTVYDASASPAVIQPGGLNIQPTTFDVTLTFAAPQSGTLLLAPVPRVSPTGLAELARRQTALLPAFPLPSLGAGETARLRTTVATLETRLQTLETAYQTLITQRAAAHPEDSHA